MTTIDNATISPQSVQLELTLAPLSEPDYSPDLSIEQRFELFHAANPHVADALEALADQWLSHGHARLGVKALFERLRWESGIQTAGDAYRLNNDFTALYARLLITRHPDWADAIQTRDRRAA